MAISNKGCCNKIEGLMDSKVSIIIPAYNVERYIRRGIESALRQSHANTEIVIIDDGSDDSTWDLVRSYSNDNRIICQKQANAGVSRARNTGIELASGAYLLFLDSDDWLEANACEVLLRKQFEYPNRLIATEFYLAKMDCAGGIVREAQGVGAPSKEFSSDEALMKIGDFSSIHAGSSCYKLFSKEVIDRGHIRFDETVSHTEDGLFVFEYLKACVGLYYEPIPLWNILERPGSATASGYSRKMLTSIASINKMLSYPGNSSELIEHLKVFRAHEALRIMGMGIDSGSMTEEDFNMLSDILTDRSLNSFKLSPVDRVRKAIYFNASGAASRLFNKGVACLKKVGK